MPEFRRVAAGALLARLEFVERVELKTVLACCAILKARLLPVFGHRPLDGSNRGTSPPTATSQLAEGLGARVRSGATRGS